MLSAATNVHRPNAVGKPNMSSIIWARRFAAGAAVLMLIGSVAACGGWPFDGPGATPTGTAAPSAIPTPTPSPTPTPTPISTLDAFKAAVMSGDFQAQGSVDGTVVARVFIGSTSGPITGTFKVRAGDSDASISSTILGSTITYDSIVVGGSAYSRTNGGGWSTSAAAGETLQGFVGSGIVITDEGGEPKWGRWLDHLTVADIAGVNPSAFGITAGPSMSNLTLESLSFWAVTDGTPAGVSIKASFDQKVFGATTHETVTLDIQIESLSGVTITAPTS
jgi:hypothetical protein